jgi:hypothetical protein
VALWRISSPPPAKMLRVMARSILAADLAALEAGLSAGAVPVAA